MAESAFSEDGKYFSAISNDGRLRIWDTETNVLLQEYTPDLHLSSPPSCLVWFHLANSESPRKGKRKSFSEDDSQCIALGTSNGKILIYSLTQAKVETILQDGQNNDAQAGITTLDWHRKYGLFSCNKKGFIQEWDLRSGISRYKYNVLAESKNKQASSVSAIKIIPHSQSATMKFLATASWQIRVFRLLEGVATITMTLGHTGAQKPLLSLAMINQKCWLISGSQNERLLSFWDVTPSADQFPKLNGTESTPTKKQRKKSITDIGPTIIQTPTYNFVLEDAPKMVDVCLNDQNGSVKAELVAATRSGVVHYYGHVLNGSSTKPIKPSVTLQVSTPDARPLPLQGGKLLKTGQGWTVIAYQDVARIIFERLTPDTTNKTQILIRGEAKPLTVERSKKKEIVNKVRSGIEDKVTYVEPLGGVARKRPATGDKVEVPLEARLSNLAVDRRRGKWAVCQNLTRLLMQGLHSKDASLINTVLQNNDAAVALRTVSGLPPDYVPMLLEQLALLASGKTSVCASVCTWLSALLQAQAALLLASLSSPESGARLSQLLAVFTQRRSHLCQLLNLKGRLELTQAQRRPPAEDVQEAVLEYNDESSLDEMELQRSESESLDEFDSDKQDMDDDDE